MTNPLAAFAKLHSLANHIHQRRNDNQPPYVLVLGAGASLSSGASSTAQIIDAVVKKHTRWNPAKLSWNKKLAAFYDTLDQISEDERYNILTPHLKEARISRGYRHLAALIKERYFDLILTTNFDLFLEDSLM